jgi:hypothetical protein
MTVCVRCKHRHRLLTSTEGIFSLVPVYEDFCFYDFWGSGKHPCQEINDGNCPHFEAKREISAEDSTSSASS